MGLFSCGGGMHSFKSRIDTDVPELAVFIIHSKTIYRIASGLSFRSVLLKTELRELFIEQVVIRKPPSIKQVQVLFTSTEWMQFTWMIPQSVVCSGYSFQSRVRSIK